MYNLHDRYRRACDDDSGQVRSNSSGILYIGRCKLGQCIVRFSFPCDVTSAGIFKQSMGARNQLGIGFLYRPARLHSLAELIPRNRFLGSLKV